MSLDRRRQFFDVMSLHGVVVDGLLSLPKELND